MSRLERLEHYAGIAVASVVALLFGASFGWTYGVDNQVIYLLPSLRILNPGVLDNDWLASATTHYHPAFAYLAAGLMAIGETAIGVGLTIVVAAGMMGVYALLRALEGVRRALPAFLLVSAIAFVTRTKAACATYVFDHILQPSTLGAAAFLASVPLFVRGRWLASGIALAVSGLFHVNFLVLLFGVYLLVHLLLGADGLRARLVRQLGPALVILLLFAPMILGTALAKDAKLAQEIYTTIRAPHHFLIRGHEDDFVPFLGWTLLGLGAIAPWARSNKSPHGRLALLLASLLTVVWGGVALAAAAELRSVRQLFPWRIVPHTQMLMWVAACAGAVRAIFEPSVWRRYSIVPFALVMTGFGVLGMSSGTRDATSLHLLLVGALALLVFVIAGSRLVGRFASVEARGRLRATWQRLALPVALVASVGAVTPVAIAQLKEFDRRSNLDDGIKAGERHLYQWMRDNTPVEAVFLTPPDVETMRFHGQRAIVVDWKSNPVVPGELLEWHRRLEKVVGKPVKSSKDLDGYSALDEARLDKLRAEYKFDYVVVRRGQERKLGKYTKKVYTGPAFVVVDVRG